MGVRIPPPVPYIVFYKLTKRIVMINYIKESYTELTQNVTWTPFNEAQRLLWVVTIFSVIFSLFIAGVDFLFESFIAQIFKIF